VNLNEAEFIDKIREASAIQQEATAKVHKKQLDKNLRRITELDALFQKIYEDNANGKINDTRFEQLSASYDTEQANLKRQNTTLQAELDTYNEDSQKTDRFIEIVKRYTAYNELSPEELTTPMLNSFIHKILVYAPDKSTGQRTQQVDIHFNFIGNFNIPQEPTPPPTQEELEAQEQRRKKRERQREANQRYYAKKKAEVEWQRAVEAGEVSQEEIETIERERRAKEELKLANYDEKLEYKRKYHREWARQSRAKKRAEKAAQEAQDTQPEQNKTA
jgi:hypothetical protein